MPDPIVPETPPAAATPPPAPAAAPWAEQAATYFGDNADAIAGFDRYMREVQQPYVTKLEEGTAEARELWTDLNADPDTTARNLIASIYREHPEVVAAYDAIFEAPAEVTPEPTATESDEIPDWAKPLVESHQEKVDREARESAAAEYSNAKAELQAAHADLTDEDLTLIDPFVYGAGGDMEQAYVAYNAWRAKAGLTPAAPVAEETPTPPPVVGDGVPTPPLATPYRTYDQVGDALRAYTQQQVVSATPPPVVG